MSRSTRNQAYLFCVFPPSSCLFLLSPLCLPSPLSGPPHPSSPPHSSLPMQHHSFFCFHLSVSHSTRNQLYPSSVFPPSPSFFLLSPTTHQVPPPPHTPLPFLLSPHCATLLPLFCFHLAVCGLTGKKIYLVYYFNPHNVSPYFSSPISPPLPPTPLHHPPSSPLCMSTFSLPFHLFVNRSPRTEVYLLSVFLHL